MLFIFTGMHVHLALVNKTTIENLERTPLFKIEGVVYEASGKSVYNLGYSRNWKSIMGNQVREWFLPVDVRYFSLYFTNEWFIRVG